MQQSPSPVSELDWKGMRVFCSKKIIWKKKSSHRGKNCWASWCRENRHLALIEFSLCSKNVNCYHPSQMGKLSLKPIYKCCCITNGFFMTLFISIYEMFNVLKIIFIFDWYMAFHSRWSRNQTCRVISLTSITNSYQVIHWLYRCN